METGIIPEIQESIKENKKLIKSFNEKTRKFINYETRIGIIEEVINDQKLLREKSAWNLNFVVDFYQIYDVAFPPLLKIEIIKEEKKLIIKTSLKKRESERSKIFRERLRKAIPFFGIQRIKSPILIPPYERELQNRLKGQFERALKQQLQNYMGDIVSELNRLYKDFHTTIEKLELPESMSMTSKNEDLGEVKKFSKLTIRGFYILSFLKAVAVSSEIVKFILQEPHLRKISKKYENLGKNLDIKPWVEILNIYRKNLPYSNVIDACAISWILKLNEIANKEKRRDIYFLLSDAHIFLNILNKFPEYNQFNKRIEPPFSPMIQHCLFPDYCRVKGLHILRTSYHFEEFVMAYNKDSLSIQISKLEERKTQLLKDIRIITPQIKNISKKCKEKSSECPCESRKDCKALIKSIDDFFKREEEITNLKNIICKEKVFAPLLEFMEKYLVEDISDSYITEIKLFEETYYKFFGKEYDPDLVERLHETLQKFEEEYLQDISSIAELSSALADTYIRTIKNQLSKMHGIVFKIAFTKNKKIKTLIDRIFNDISIDKINKIDNKNWFQEIFKIITENKNDDIEVTLLTIILLYSYELYNDSSWIAKQYLDEKFDIVKKSNKEVEFNYMIASSEARKLYSHKNPIVAKEELDKIVKNLTVLERKYPRDIRIPYLIGKILARKYLFTGESEEAPLLESINYSRKAIHILNSHDRELEKGFETLRIPLKNNILYCITKLKIPNEEQLKEAEILYHVIEKCRDKSHYIETCASYDYFKARQFYKENKKKSAEFFRKALHNLLTAIGYGKNQNINSQEFHLLKLQLDDWVQEYESKYSEKIVDTVKEWGIEIEKELL